MIRRFALAIILALGIAAPANADPVSVAIGATIKSIAAFAASSAIAAAIVQTAISVGISMLAQALRKKQRPPGIKTEVTTTGGITPQSFILGRSATGGQLIAPPMSHGSAGDTPRAYLVYVIALGAIPGQTLERVAIDDDYVTFGDTAPWGRAVTGAYAGHVWVDYLDGSQLEAHPRLLAAFGTDPDRPWLADMVNPGTCYAVARFKYKRELYNNLPSVRFECLGIPLYDPRKDSSAGGSGPHRWDDPGTWAQTENLAVIIYNIMRGISLPDGNIWGGECTVEELPFANWVAAMNECDLPIDDGAGGSVPQYRGGLEVSVDEEPADIIDELLKSCSGQMVDIGGIWKIRVGGPGLPVFFLSDDDILITEAETRIPFPGLANTYNAIHAVHPEPDSLWETVDAPARYHPDLEAEDQGRRLVADLAFPAVPYGNQVQRLMQAYINEERRFLRHRPPVAPWAAVLEPLDTIAWTSARYGYAGKAFEIAEIIDDPMTLNQTLGLRERDPADYVWHPADALPTTPAHPGANLPVAQAVPGWSVLGDAIKDATGTDRRPALILQWTGDLPDVRAVMWEVRLAATGVAVSSGTASDVEAGGIIISEGILPDTTYEARGRLLVDRPTTWTAWLSATTPDIRLAEDDLAEPFASRINTAVEDAQAALDRLDHVEGDIIRVEHAVTTAARAGTGGVSKNPVFNLWEDGERRNLLRWSEDLTQGAWAKAQATVSSGQSDPGGGNTAWAILDATTGNDPHRVTQPVPVEAGEECTVRVGVKGVSVDYFAPSLQGGIVGLNTNVVFNLVTGEVEALNGSVIRAEMTPLGSGWFLCEFTFVSENTGNPVVFFNPSMFGSSPNFPGEIGRESIHIWRPQVERGPIATPYQRTTSTFLAASPDHLTLTGDRANLFSGVFGINAGMSQVAEGSIVTATPTVTGTAVAHGLLAPVSADGPRVTSFEIKKSAGAQFDWMRIQYRHSFDGANDWPAIYFNLTTGAIASGSTFLTTTLLDGGWLRVVFLVSPAHGNSDSFGFFPSLTHDHHGINYIADGTSHFLVRNFQRELGTHPTPYQNPNDSFLSPPGVSGNGAYAVTPPLARYSKALRVDAIGNGIGPALSLSRSTHGLDCAPAPERILVRLEIELETVANFATWGGEVQARWDDNGTPRIVGMLLRDQIQNSPGVVQVVEIMIDRPDEWQGGGLQDFRLGIIGRGVTGSTATFIIHRLDFEEILAQSYTGLTQQAITTTEAMAARQYLSAVAGEEGASLELIAYDGIEGSGSLIRLNAQDVIVEGTITTEHLNVEWMEAGRIQADYIDVNALLTIQPNAGFRYGKSSTQDDGNEGIYLGRDGADFGFAASRNNNADPENPKTQSLKITRGTGLQLLNARHFISGSVPPVTTLPITTSQSKQALPEGIVTISFEMIGGGSGGVGHVSGSSFIAHDGTDTVVRLYDGTTLKHTIVAEGAAAQTNYGEISANVNNMRGQASAYGAGGNFGSSYETESGSSVVVPATPPAPGHYGAGGGAGYRRRRGLAATRLLSGNIDVSGWADPQIEIVSIGAGGAGSVSTPTTAYHSSAGAPGMVQYTYSRAADLPADVIPLIPTATGTFTKSGASAPFPDLGAGLWVISIDSGTNGMDMGNVEISPGQNVWLQGMRSATFVSSQTPVHVSGGGNARTIRYAFYSMGDWG